MALQDINKFMAQVIKSPQTKIVTKNGEIELSIIIEPIVIEVILNVNSDGIVSLGSTKTEPNIQAQKVEEPEIPTWIVPTFGSQKLKFGKDA